MLWNEITIHTTEEAIEMISNFLHEAGAGGVSIEESGSLNKPRDTSYGQWYDRPLNDIPEGQAIIKGYFAEEVDMDRIRSQIEPRVEELRTFDIDPGEVQYELKTVDEDDWANAWKQYFKPLRVSDRLTIKPTWEDYEPASEEEKIIELDPGMAFGTGTHPTTSLCLRTLESVIKGGEEVIDVGTGSGILAIGAVKLGAKHVLALDLDPVAVSSARENTRLNGLEERITIKESDLLSVLNASDPTLGIQLPVKLVVANILAEIILLFIDDVYKALEPGGIYIASGIWKNKEEVVETALKAAGFEIAEISRDEDWLAFVARKR
ncbi:MULTISPECIES: 50S ribosomal protein L11 methyltransferase [Paenibacillus]|uniref:Ribosomal protein L11 methyltransferase n=2 Tax=Paenibacillus TaxID=44249 RepID=A0ABX2Z479_PAEPO|nr:MULTISPECIES: 50S ribosomal protein L11 methyltransferase [Paenibacillus]AIW40835.1 50S ribosomal protein L11 methyltransferase [Paenibacillus polymyxa CR1]ALA43127.1 50S ribosomal protein L11 methyltransferase [Paenibacillus peoriae]APB75085.1 50S ribosomal protein L11 methyltransferase [Paenibacillus polymyxa]APQ60387.1 50S ribosomal protein L11 methyltransferase [Paenibacillus polymyxa]MBP1177342.1 ribosomal protein L11 methyltransferase [Paenibacillus sp. PvR133]